MQLLAVGVDPLVGHCNPGKVRSGAFETLVRSRIESDADSVKILVRRLMRPALEWEALRHQCRPRRSSRLASRLNVPEARGTAPRLVLKLAAVDGDLTAR
jgi:hypothetical protein